MTENNNNVVEQFLVGGKRRLAGTIPVGGSKNSVVALLAAVIIAGGECVIENVPNISDVQIDLKILEWLGVKITPDPYDIHTLRIDPTTIENKEIPYELTTQMRASYYFVSALLARFGSAKVGPPGGCKLGPRLFDQHEKAVCALGAKWDVEGGFFEVGVEEGERLKGANIYFDRVSVGATINAMLAAVCAEGLTVLENCAREPHVVDVAIFLNSMGAEVLGAGTETIRVRGVERSKLSGANHIVIPDQIEAGTFMLAAAITKGDVTLLNVIPKHLEFLTSKLRKMDFEIEETDETIRVFTPEGFDSPRYSGEPKRVDLKISTQPHPGFPTDLHPLFAALLASDDRYSGTISEMIFDSRFNYAEHLSRMGGDLTVDGKAVVIKGVKSLKGARVTACDLRAGAALIVAALSADGMTAIDNISHIKRGYEDIDSKLRAIGANIWISTGAKPDFSGKNTTPASEFNNEFFCENLFAQGE